MEQERNYDTKDIVSLLGVYESEWEHRDSFMRTMMFTLFYAATIVGLLPFLRDYMQLDFTPSISILFPCVGLFMAFYFILVSISYYARLDAARLTMDNLIALLPPELHRVRLSDIQKYQRSRFVKLPLGLWIPLCLFLFLFSINAFALGYLLVTMLPHGTARIVSIVAVSLAEVAVIAFVILYWRSHTRVAKA